MLVIIALLNTWCDDHYAGKLNAICKQKAVECAHVKDKLGTKKKIIVPVCQVSVPEAIKREVLN